MIVVTGAGGFIGSAMIGYLNSIGRNDIIAVDDLPNPDQYKNLIGKTFTLVSSDEVAEFEQYGPGKIDCILHFGAISDTLANDWSQLYKQNVLSTRRWANLANKLRIPLVFASTAAIYGNGTGPLNQYAFSKQVSENELGNYAACLRLFNVYGPNENHKGRMASTIFHWYEQIRETGSIKIFEGSDEFFRDFIYVEDVCRTFWHFAENFKPGIYDVGTGKQESFEHVADCLIEAVGAEVYKEYVEMPEDLNKQYQKSTRANLTALDKAGFVTDTYRSVLEGVEDYVEYLKTNSRL